MSAQEHIPVLLREVVEVLRPRADGIYVDGTFGSGGYAAALLDAAPCRVWGIDRDPEAVRRGDEMARRFDGRLTVLHGRFGDMVELLRARQVTAVDGVALDLGVSSMQIDDPARGFSFREDGPLDMRMERSGPTAAHVVNTLDEGALADLIYAYGEERRARRVAKAIVAARAEKPITRTGELAEIVRRAVPPSKDGIDPATRTFQALRIHVNDELRQLDAGLEAAEILLRPGGRLAAVSFHSLEDRRVKEFLRTRSGAAPRASRHLPAEREGRQPTFTLLHRKPIRPSAAEIAANPRARSARLRAAERTAAPAWDAHPKGNA
ncbi:MAG TPA: 16S rRNA (cytosine(1402)-N(4))-methyltransferase RsmH [Alphaproteobacteria bacterium]